MYMQLINKYKIHNPHFENNLKWFLFFIFWKTFQEEEFYTDTTMNAFWIFLDEPKKNVVCSQPSSWIISRALSNQNIIGLTNISIVLKPEPKRTTVCKRMEWVRGHFWNSSLMIGQKGQIWSTEKCFLRHFLVHTPWQNL